jgi:hypothetical protein
MIMLQRKSFSRQNQSQICVMSIVGESIVSIPSTFGFSEADASQIRINSILN